MTPKSNDLRES